jgi:periplasmic divalent cation tolerance protein
MADEYVLVLCTCPGNTVAAEIATAVIEQNLAACVNRIPGVKSWYRWEGHLEQDEEVLLLVKTTRARLTALEAMISKVHPAELPEVIAVPIIAGSEAYLRWVSAATAAP